MGIDAAQRQEARVYFVVAVGVARCPSRRIVLLVLVLVLLLVLRTTAMQLAAEVNGR